MARGVPLQGSADRVMCPSPRPNNSNSLGNLMLSIFVVNMAPWALEDACLWFCSLSLCVLFLLHCRVEVFPASCRSLRASSAHIGFPLHLILLFRQYTTNLILLWFTHQNQCGFLLPPKPISILHIGFLLFFLARANTG